MDIVFLDANVLYSAAYKLDSPTRRFWRLADARLVTSAYAVEEASRNLLDSRHRVELESLVTQVKVVAESSRYPEGIALALKDRPILSAAIAAGATHLVSGDIRHFGPLYGTTVRGVTIVSPARYWELDRNRRA